MKGFPKTARFLVSDDVRDEVGGKHTIVGVFSGDNILYETPEGAAPGSRPMLPSIALYAVFSDGEGEFDARMDIEAPSKSKVFSTAPLRVRIERGHNMILIFKVANFGLAEDGAYTFRIFLDDHDYPFKVTVEESKRELPKAAAGAKPAKK